MSDLMKRIERLEEIAQEALRQQEEKESVEYAKPAIRYGIYTAIVISTFDVWKQNRVQFYLPTTDDATPAVDGLPWASPISSFGGFDDSGATWVPPAGSKIAIVFENGQNGAAYYLGTVWTRKRGPGNTNDFGFPVPEFQALYQGENLRNGYLCGPNDGSQVLPPWNTENYNGFDIDSLRNLDKDPNAVRRQTFPNIYGFKTPEKHMMKMVDGDALCNRKWKRIEIMSGCGNWMIFKDDHLHYCGQWANPQCFPKSGSINEKNAGGSRLGDTSCIKGIPNPTADTSNSPSRFNNTNIGRYNPPNINLDIINQASEKTFCTTDGSKTADQNAVYYQKKPSESVQNKTIIGGQPESQVNPYTQKGTNPFFKNQNECRPYMGPLTPQNNKCDLPQTGIQFLSISGHTFVMDDSVAQPRGSMSWKRSLSEFDFGCNNKFYGRTYWKSTTGHLIEMNDLERPTGNAVRSEKNGIKIKSATGNEIFLCDSMTGKDLYTATASKEHGITITTGSKHKITMSDDGNTKDWKYRKDGTERKSNANKAFVKIETGYGLAIEMNDARQKEDDYQFIKISTPVRTSKVGGGTSGHMLLFQENKDTAGFIQLRSTGNLIIQSSDSVLTSTDGDVYNYVKNNKLDYTVGKTFIRAKDKIVMQSEDSVYILAGNDYPIKTTESKGVNDFVAKSGEVSPFNDTVSSYLKTGIDTKKGPGVFSVLILKNGKITASDRLYASCSQAVGGLSLGNLILPEQVAIDGEYKRFSL